MGRQRSPNRDEAFNLYKESGGRLSSTEIADQLGEKLNNIKTWRVKDRWKDRVGKVGAPYGNQNAVGNSGGGAPTHNMNHYIHGLFSKYLPKATVDILKDTEGMAPIDILYLNIRMKFAAIIHSQKIMFVEDKEDMTKELKREKEFESSQGDGWEKEYEIQFAWDKQERSLKAQAVAMGQLTNMIKRYDEMLHANWDMVTEEQKQRIKKIKEHIQIERERFDHQKKMDELKNF